MVFVIDSVLEPLLTNSIRNASFNQDITAGKLLARCVELTVIIRNFADVVTDNVEPNWSTNIFNKYMCNGYPHLPRTTLYNLGDEGWARIFYNLAKQVIIVFINIIIIFYNIVIIIFYNLAKQNQRERMFDVTGKHTFFFPVDSAFEVDIYIR